MADLGEIQTRFDSDPALCKRFLLDPVGVIAELGVVLAPQQAFRLQQDVMKLTKSLELSGAQGIVTHPPTVVASVA